MEHCYIIGTVMGKSKSSNEAQPSSQEHLAAPPSFTWVLYLIVVLIAVGMYALYTNQQRRDPAEMQAQSADQERYRATLAELNREAGLPITYPLDFMPLYPGVELIEATAEDATADDGTPMDMWHILSQTDDAKQAVYDFYMQRIEAEDMRQTLYISLPTGYKFSYADENRIADIRIEKLNKDPKLQVELTLYVVKGEPASKSHFDLGSYTPPSTAEHPDTLEPKPVADEQVAETGTEDQADKPTSDPPA